MSTFHRLLGVTLIAVTANNFVWFALTYWAYLSTKSVIATSTMAGIYLVVAAVSGIWTGSIVDHHKKKIAMLGSSAVSLLLFSGGLAMFHATPPEAFATVASLRLWAFVAVLLCGTIAGSVYNIAMPTLVGLIVPEEVRDKANGLFGTVTGVAFGITSVASGFALAAGGMVLVLRVAIAASAVAIAALLLMRVPEPEVVRAKDEKANGIDLRGTIAAVRAIPGLFALIIFSTFNNFLGGAFFALMDAYGLSLMSVEAWGALWGVLSFSLIFGGIYVARRGLGKHPVRSLFRINVVTWTACVFFVIQPSVLLLAAGVFTWMFFAPHIEATEQTIFQKVVPADRLGRVFGFAHSVEQSASPLTAFLIGPIAQAVFIPFMTTGRGVELIGPWFGTGAGRGIALVFIASGFIGLMVTLFAMRSRSYALLARRYEEGTAASTVPRP